MWSREDLLSSLKALGLLRSPGVERAVRAVDQEAFLPDGLGALAYADMPLPSLSSMSGRPLASARCLVAALELLEPAAGLRVLVEGARGGYPAALLAHVVGPERVVVLEPDADAREAARERLDRAGLGAVDVREDPPEEPVDRILVMDPKDARPKELVAHLEDLGFLITRGRGVEELAFVKILRNGRETVRLTFSQAPASLLAGGSRAEAMAPVDFARLFAVEDLLAHAWEGRVSGHYDQHFQDVADETFADGPLDLESFNPEREPVKLAARRVFQAAYILQSAGELDRAADAYARSIALVPTSEAHTFLGWTWSFTGRYDDAIAECERAIETDPTFGNPYNDIGAYLIELGRIDHAIPWLERALAATRYSCYFYAHTNLARAYVQKGMPERARKCLLAALDVNPGYEPAQELLRRLDGASGYFA